MRLLPIKRIGNSKLLRILWEQTALPVLLRRWRVPLLHAPAYVAPLLAPCPYVLTVHDLHVFTHPEFCSASNRLHYRVIMPRSIRRAAKIVAFSEHTRDKISARFPEAATKITVVPPGIQPDLKPCSDQARMQTVKTRYGLAENFLLFVGDLTSRKNIDGIIRAFAALRSKQPELHLTLAGHCDRRMGSVLTAAAAETGVAGKLILPGYIAPADLAVVYSMAALLVFPSHDEGFGLPPLEAMACGCPVVCSRGPLSAMHGPAVTACDAEAPASIADACRRLLENDPYREAQIRAGFQRAATFSWKSSAEALETIYRELQDFSCLKPRPGN